MLFLISSTNIPLRAGYESLISTINRLIFNLITTYDEKNLRNRIIECICRKLLKDNLRSFHGVDMVKDCAKGFLDEKGVAQYEFSGEHEYYKDVLEKIYRPLVLRGLLKQYENNNFKVPEGSKLEGICRKELNHGREYIEWDRVDWD
jgi:hypothetical protein